MISYYTLPSTIVDHPRYKALKAAYSFYNVATKCDLTELMNDALVLARNVSYAKPHILTFCFSVFFKVVNYNETTSYQTDGVSQFQNWR